MVIIKDDIKAQILSVKTLTELHNFNPEKYLTLQDLHNSHAKICWQELLYLTNI